jgi:hypothetical protein
VRHRLPQRVGLGVGLVAGFPAATLFALGCYLVALADVRFGEWPERAPDGAAEDAFAQAAGRSMTATTTPRAE